MTREETPKFGMSKAIDEFEKGLTTEDIKNAPFAMVEQAIRFGAEWQRKKDYAVVDSSAWDIITEEYPDATMEERDRMYEIAIRCLLAGGEKNKQFIKNDTLNKICDYLRKNNKDSVLTEQLLNDLIEHFINEE